MVFAIEGWLVFEQREGGGLFATRGVLFLVVNGERLRRAVLVLGQGEDADVFAHHLAVKGQGLREVAGLLAQPIA